MKGKKTSISLQSDENASLKAGLEFAGIAKRRDPKYAAAEQVTEIIIHWCPLPDCPNLMSCSEPGTANYMSET